MEACILPKIISSSTQIRIWTGFFFVFDGVKWVLKGSGAVTQAALLKYSTKTQKVLNLAGKILLAVPSASIVVAVAVQSQLYHISSLFTVLFVAHTH